MHAWSSLSYLCKSGGDVLTKYNCLQDCFAEFCRKACLAPQLERGSGIVFNTDRSRPADVLVPNWCLSRPAALPDPLSS